MGYAYIDTTGLRDRRTKLELAVTDLRSIRDRASAVLEAGQAGHERSILDGFTPGIALVDTWADRITDHITNAELGPTWRTMNALLAPFGWLGQDEATRREKSYRFVIGRVVEALRNGESPEEAGLSPHLFPSHYLQIMGQVADLEAEAVDLAVEAYIHGGGGGFELAATELLAEAHGLRPSYDLEAIREFIYSTPVLESIDQRHEAFADVLVGDLEAAGLAEPWLSPAPQQLEVAAVELALGSAGLAAAFFERLGAEQTALIDAHFRREDDQSAVQAFARALADASHILPDAFAVELIRAGDTHFIFEMRVGSLFVEGDFEFGFLEAAYDQAERQFDDNRYVDWLGSPPEFDARTVLLNRIVEHPQFRPVSFLTPERIVELFDEPYLDEGFAAMKPLLALGALEPASAEVRDRIADIVAHVGRAGGTLQRYTAMGAAAMVDAHIPLFAVERWYNPETDLFEHAVDSTARSQSLQLHEYGPAGEAAEIAFERDKVMFLEVVMRDPLAQAMLFDSLAGSVASLARTHMTDVESAISGSDDLGALVGRFADVAGGLAQQEGKSRDTANTWNKWLVGTTISVAGSLLVAHYVSGLAAATLLKQVIGVGRSTATSLSLNRIFPTDNEKGAIEGRFHEVVSLEPGREYRQLVSQLLYETSPELFDLDRIPTTIVDDGRWVDPTGGSHGYCIDPDVWTNAWIGWWNSDPFVTPGTYDLVATVSDSFSALRGYGSAVEVNGPDLPFTKP